MLQGEVVQCYEPGIHSRRFNVGMQGFPFDDEVV